jgi:hypothetical protein
MFPVKMTVLWDVRHVVWKKFIDVLEVLIASIIRIVEARSMSEMLLNLCETTQHNIPEDSPSFLYSPPLGPEVSLCSLLV